VPMPVIDAASAGPALNQAANRVAAEVAAWVG
jgi:cholesterol transport system auxiliary component